MIEAEFEPILFPIKLRHLISTANIPGCEGSPRAVSKLGSRYLNATETRQYLKWLQLKSWAYRP